MEFPINLLANLQPLLQQSCKTTQLINLSTTRKSGEESRRSPAISFRIMDWSPKRQLASRLTEFLKSYCSGIDIQAVQAKLLTDTRIELEHVCLDVEGIVGSVNSIIFAWRWGAKESPALLGIRECTLEIRGVRIETGLGCSAEPAVGASKNPEPQETRTGSTSFFERFLDSYVQGLIDSMTVKLFDVEVLVEKELVLSFDSLVLASFGKRESALSQSISVEGFSITCRSCGQKLLEPFAYSASVNRINGKRFGSFVHGLEIVGNKPERAAKINIESMRTLLPLLQKVFSRDEDAEKSTSVDGTATTRIILPLPDFVFVLPNNTPFTIHAITLSYSLNGSVFQLSGNRGMSSNGWPVLRLGEGAIWCADLVRQSISVVRDGFVDATSTEDSDNYLLDLEWFGQCGVPLLTGFLELREILSQLTLTQRGSSEDGKLSTVGADPWKMSVDGNVLLRVKDDNENWIQVELDRPFLTASKVESTIEAIKLTSSSGLLISLPRIRFESAFAVIGLDGVVSCQLRTLSDLNEVLELLQTQFPETLAGPHRQPIGVDGEKQETEIDCAPTVPCCVTIPKIHLTVEKEGIDVSMNDVVADEALNDIRFAHLQFSDAAGTIVSASGFVFSLNEGCATLSAIESLYIPGVASISRPIRLIVVRGLLQKHFKVYVPSASFLLLDSSKEPGQRNESPSVPFPIACYASEVSIESNSKRVAMISGVQIDLKDEGGLRFEFRLKKLESRMVHLHGSSLVGIVGVDTIYGLRVQPGLVKIGTDISSFDWSLLLPDREGRLPPAPAIWNMPHVVMDSFAIQISLQKNSLSTGKPHRIAKYQGGPMTTSADLNEYGYKLLMNEFPHLYTKTMVCGVRATDLTAKAAGRLAGTTMIGSAFGSVGALMATDTLKTVFSLGRKSRDDADEKKLRSRDLFVGLWHATKATAKLGGELRRGDIDYHYEPGDVLYGASKSFSLYVQTNSSRFGAAACSTLGLACGGALYGFGGMMIGNVVGGQAGALLFESKNGCPRLEDFEMDLEVETLGADNSEESWLLVSFTEGIGSKESHCDISQTMICDGIMSEPPLLVDESTTEQTRLDEDSNHRRIPVPSAPKAEWIEDSIAIEGPKLEPAKDTNCKRSYRENLKREFRRVLGFGPSNRKTWTAG